MYQINFDVENPNDFEEVEEHVRKQCEEFNCLDKVKLIMDGYIKDISNKKNNTGHHEIDLGSNYLIW